MTDQPDAPDPHDDLFHRPGGVIFAGLFLAIAVLLFSQLGAETKFSAKAWGTKKMFAQPGFWPGVGIIGMCVFGILHAIAAWSRRAGREVFEAVQWLRALEYLGWFMAYVWAVPFIGYLPATLIFMGALAVRAGYRNRRMILAALATGLGIVLVFKTMLSVKIPGGALYAVLPDWLRNIAILNF